MTIPTEVNLAYWENIQFHHEGDRFFEDIFDAIESAQHSVRIESYIFEVDSLSLRLFQHLHGAKKRGCHIELLVDGFGSYYWLNAIQEQCLKYQISWTVFHPLPRRLSWIKLFLWPSLFQIFKILRSLNRRNHRKLVLIDDRIAFLGSFNWTQVHSQFHHGKSAWRDSGVRIEQGSVQDLVNAFKDRWYQSTLRGIHRFQRPRRLEKNYSPQRSLVRLNSSLRSRRWLYRDFLQRVKNANQSIQICTAYFLPRRRLIKALANAAHRHIPVQILIPGQSDVPAVKLAARGLIIYLLKRGVKVYEYQPTVLHAKYSILDQWASIGSFNHNHRSLLLDLEVEACFMDPPSLLLLKNQFKMDIENSKELQIADFQNDPWLKKVISQILFRLRFIL